MSVKINIHFRVCVCLIGLSQTQTSQRKDRHMKRAIFFFFFLRNMSENLLFHIKQLQWKIIISKASKNEETGKHTRLAVGLV